jgi:hypothetical protein
MKRRVLLASLIASFSSLGQTRRKETGKACIEVVSLKLERAGKQITIDGTIRNTGARPLGKLVLAFELLDADEKTISRRRGPIEEDALGLGAESSFGFFVEDQARAVSVRVQAEFREMHIDVVKAGPYYIE